MLYSVNKKLVANIQTQRLLFQTVSCKIFFFQTIVQWFFGQLISFGQEECALRLIDINWFLPLLKSVHFKNTVLSKLRSFSIIHQLTLFWFQMMYYERTLQFSRIRNSKTAAYLCRANRYKWFLCLDQHTQLRVFQTSLNRHWIPRDNPEPIRQGGKWQIILGCTLWSIFWPLCAVAFWGEIFFRFAFIFLKPNYLKCQYFTVITVMFIYKEYFGCGVLNRLYNVLNFLKMNNMA